MTETRHAGGDNFGNVFIIGQVSVQNHPKVFSGVFRLSSLPIKVRHGVTNLECIFLLWKSISLALLGFNNKKLMEHHWRILCKSSVKLAKTSKLTFILKEITTGSLVSSIYTCTSEHCILVLCCIFYSLLNRNGIKD